MTTSIIAMKTLSNASLLLRRIGGLRAGPAVIAVIAALVLALPSPAAAQLDPLLFLKHTPPNVLIAVDTANRMQRDVNNDYRDANIYQRLGEAAAPWEAGLPFADTTSTKYRRKYVGLVNVDQGSGSGDKFQADHIEVVGDREPGYSTFDDATRIAIARKSLIEAVTRNLSVARYGLFRLRQSSPRYETPASSDADRWKINEKPVKITNASPAWEKQTTTGDDSNGRWRITRPVVSGANSSVSGPVAPLVSPSSASANADVLRILGLSTGAADSLIPAGQDASNRSDIPLARMLDDLKIAAEKLIIADCRNTVVVLVAGGGEGDITSEDVAARAKQFLNVVGHRVPIYVVGIAPLSDTGRAQLQSIATESGGVFTEITAAMVDAVAAGNPVPEFVRAVNNAIAHAFSAQADFDIAPSTTHPHGFGTEHQVTSPIIGTVNIEGRNDMSGNALPYDTIYDPATNVKIPQRSNVMITSGFSLPGFDARLRAFRVYKPEPVRNKVDETQIERYKFVADGTPLWMASVPAAAQRNIYTALPDGTIIPFTAANAEELQPYLKTADLASTAALIEFIRSQPLGAIVSSTPAIMDPPSVDPPPDTIYPAFAEKHKNRRSIIWIGANDGMLHGIDARLGKEVWAFVPFNLLPKLRALLSGQPVGEFRYFVDGSPKVADVRIGSNWRTYLIMGEGPGGTFYQTFDVTLDGIASYAAPTSDVLGDVLKYFSQVESVPLKWTFPLYKHFDVNVGEWGDIAATAPAIAKTVGLTWSDPAVGQIESGQGRFAVLTGSGFFPWSSQQQANRGGAVAGTTFYMLDVETGEVLDSLDVGSDGKAETGLAGDDCVLVTKCTELKNALQADPVATGPPDSRFITKVYIGDLDGRVWRFDVGLDTTLAPKFKSQTMLYGKTGNAAHPNFSSMATVNVGGAQQYLFQGTGSDLLPSAGVSQSYEILLLLDDGSTGKIATSDGKPIQLTQVNSNGGEKVSSFPAVAGDIVFFATTKFGKASGCWVPTANLYAFTFIGGPAYDNTNDGRLTSADTPLVRTTVGARASAPFISDQHLVFATGDKVELFGDREDFNNGVGQAGVRILSWREIR